MQASVRLAVVERYDMGVGKGPLPFSHQLASNTLTQRSDINAQEFGKRLAPVLKVHSWMASPKAFVRGRLQLHMGGEGQNGQRSFEIQAPRRVYDCGGNLKAGGLVCTKVFSQDQSFPLIFASEGSDAKGSGEEEVVVEEEERRKWGGEGEAKKDEKEVTAQREQHFLQMLQIPEEKRRELEEKQTMVRAAAALAAAQSLLAEVGPRERLERQTSRGRAIATGGARPSWLGRTVLMEKKLEKERSGLHPSGGGSSGLSLRSHGDVTNIGGVGAVGGGGGGGGGGVGNATPGPDFWKWTPPTANAASASASASPSRASGVPLPSPKPSPRSRARPLVAMLDRGRPMPSGLTIPLQSELMAAGTEEDLGLLSSGPAPFELPPMQSTVEMQRAEEKADEDRGRVLAEEAEERLEEVRAYALEAARGARDSPSGNDSGVDAEGMRWWKEWGVEERENGEVCEWTVVRAVSADGSVEWQEKWWETSDPFDYKELGAEKTGRDRTGGVWRETWREAMWQDARNGLPHIEKSADKWARNGEGGEWQEKWWEHYDGVGHAEKNAEKWSKIDTATPLDAGHAHVWHEKWGEEYDGKGAAMKYCDKWAERYVGNGQWTKWGDKWDEKFNQSAQGHRQGETWWEGAWGERWNRTWSEGHNGSGWVHKRGDSSSGEHWDVHEPMDTWYERKPHYGFKECMDQSRRLRNVGKPKRRL